MRSSVDDLPDDSFPMTMMRGSTISSPIFFMPALVSLRISAIFLITWPYLSCSSNGMANAAALAMPWFPFCRFRPGSCSTTPFETSDRHITSGLGEPRRLLCPISILTLAILVKTRSLAQGLCAGCLRGFADADFVLCFVSTYKIF